MTLKPVHLPPFAYEYLVCFFTWMEHCKGNLPQHPPNHWFLDSTWDFGGKKQLLGGAGHNWTFFQGNETNGVPRISPHTPELGIAWSNFHSSV